MKKIKIIAGIAALCATLPAQEELLAGNIEITAPSQAVVGQTVELQMKAFSPNGPIYSYGWDFDGDGVDDETSTSSPVTTRRFDKPGRYFVTANAMLSSGEEVPSASHLIEVVDSGTVGGIQSYSMERMAVQSVATPPADGVETRYALITNGGSEQRFWDDMLYLYDMLKQYQLSDQNIYLLNYRGTDPAGNNPNNMIDDHFTPETFAATCAELASKVDGDDILYVWVDDHGNGYNGPRQFGSQKRNYGYITVPVDSDSADEYDYPESDFKIRALSCFGDINKANNNYDIGMEVWGVDSARMVNPAGAIRYAREKYVSSFSNVFIEKNNATLSDSDVKIEKFRDFLLGDTNRDGLIETSKGEVFDYDGDGVPPYNRYTGVFDEDDWGEIDEIQDDWNWFHGFAPINPHKYQFFDAGLDNKVDIDLNYQGGPLTVDGTDLDNNGRFDRIDINEDGDYNDAISIDENISTSSGEIYDDEFAAHINTIKAGAMVFVFEPCFSGGFIDDLAGPGRVVFAPTDGQAVSWGNLFIRNVISAFSGKTYPGGTSVDPATADTDGNGEISFFEAYNYATLNDTYQEVPQYEDNGDGISVEEIASGYFEGVLGKSIYLTANKSHYRDITFRDTTVTDAGMLSTPYTVTLEALTVEPTGSVTATAGDTVRLGADFHAQYGSELRLTAEQ